MTVNQKQPWNIPLPLPLPRKENRIVYCTVESFGGTKILYTKPAKAMVAARRKRRVRRGGGGGGGGAAADVPRDLKGVSVDQILLHDYWCDITLMAQYYGVLGSPQSAFDD